MKIYPFFKKIYSYSYYIVLCTDIWAININIIIILISQITFLFTGNEEEIFFKNSLEVFLRDN